MISLTRTSEIGIYADSLAATFGVGTTPFWSPWQQTLAARCGAFSQPALGQVNPRRTRRVPRLYFDQLGGGTAGRGFGSAAATVVNDLKNFPRLTHLGWQLGINDCATLTGGTLAAFLVNVQTCLTAGLAIVPGVNQFILGPYAHDSGDFAAAIALFEANVPALILAMGGTYVQWSGVSNGGGNTIADGTHTTTQGGFALAAVTNLQVQVSL